MENSMQHLAYRNVKLRVSVAILEVQSKIFVLACTVPVQYDNLAHHMIAWQQVHLPQSHAKLLD